MANPRNSNFSWQSSLSVLPQSSSSEIFRDFSSLPVATASTLAQTTVRSTSVASSDIVSTTASLDPPRLSVKLPDLSASCSSSEEENDVSPMAESEENARKSPPPNCAICLGRCKNKCFTDSCMHQFCFKCLCEWSKVKPECPLCKQNFKAIIHNVKSMDQFEEYLVPPVQQRQEHSLQWRLQTGYTAARFDAYVEEMLMNRASLPTVRRDNRHVFSFRRGGLSTSTETQTRTNTSVRFHTHDFFELYSQYPESASNTYLSQIWRKYIYDRKLFALPVSDVTGRFRESNSRFYRDNPAQMERLIPWIHRDITSLVRSSEDNVSNILNNISDALKMCNILSPMFRRRLQPFLGTRTSHFIHELYNFARSPYDMIGYDRVVQYSQTREEILIDYLSSSSTENVEVSDVGVIVNVDIDDSDAGSTVAVSSPANRISSEQEENVSNTVESNRPLNVMSFAVSTSTDGSETTAISSSPAHQRLSSAVSQTGAINLSTHNRQSEQLDIHRVLNIDHLDGDDVAYARNSNSSSNSPSTPRTPNNNVYPVVLTLSSSDSECEFVLEQKPPHLRTPELVSLNSESDSDVVFINETVNPNYDANIPNIHSQSKSRRNLKRRSLRDCTFNNSSDSEDSQMQKVPEKKLKLIENKAVIKSASEEEYNVGASTSKGLRNNRINRKKRQRSVRLKRKRSVRCLSKAPQSRCQRSSDESTICCKESADDNNDDTSDEDQPLIRFCRYQPQKKNNFPVLEEGKPKTESSSSNGSETKRCLTTTFFDQTSSSVKVKSNLPKDNALESGAQSTSNDLPISKKQLDSQSVSNSSWNTQNGSILEEKATDIVQKIEKLNNNLNSEEENQFKAELSDSSESSSLSSTYRKYNTEDAGSTTSSVFSQESSSASSTFVDSMSQQDTQNETVQPNPSTLQLKSTVKRNTVLSDTQDYSDSD